MNMEVIFAVFELTIRLLLLGVFALGIALASVAVCFMISHRYADSNGWLKNDKKGRLD